MKSVTLNKNRQYCWRWWGYTYRTVTPAAWTASMLSHTCTRTHRGEENLIKHENNGNPVSCDPPVVGFTNKMWHRQKWGTVHTQGSSASHVMPPTGRCAWRSATLRQPHLEPSPHDADDVSPLPNTFISLWMRFCVHAHERRMYCVLGLMLSFNDDDQMKETFVSADELSAARDCNESCLILPRGCSFRHL